MEEFITDFCSAWTGKAVFDVRKSLSRDSGHQQTRWPEAPSSGRVSCDATATCLLGGVKVKTRAESQAVQLAAPGIVCTAIAGAASREP